MLIYMFRLIVDCQWYPVPNGKKHASELAKLSLQMSKAFDDFRIPHRPNEAPRIRIGLHSGHCKRPAQNAHENAMLYWCQNLLEPVPLQAVPVL